MLENFPFPLWNLIHLEKTALVQVPLCCGWLFFSYSVLAMRNISFEEVDGKRLRILADIAISCFRYLLFHVGNFICRKAILSTVKRTRAFLTMLICYLSKSWSNFAHCLSEIRRPQLWRSPTVSRPKKIGLKQQVFMIGYLSVFAGCRQLKGGDLFLSNLFPELTHDRAKLTRKRRKNLICYCL